LAARYIARLADVARIQFPRDPQRSTWQVFPVLMPTRTGASALVESARELGMEVRRYYWPSLTHWFKGTACPNSDSLADRMICFPIYSCDDQIGAEMADIVEASVTRALRKAGS
jgi:dTDP-4-amino-4,6-dideoxygalactose transaminase